MDSSLALAGGLLVDNNRQKSDKWFEAWEPGFSLSKVHASASDWLLRFSPFMRQQPETHEC